MYVAKYLPVVRHPYFVFRTKLSLSHALAQSVKISLVRWDSFLLDTKFDVLPQFEDLISSTIDQTKDVPEIISETGKVGMPHKRKLVNYCRMNVGKSLL